MPSIAAFSTKGFHFYFQSARAKIDGKVASHLVQFIEGAKHSLDVAIYDMKNPDVLKALKKMSSSAHLHILYDGGKGSGVGGGSTNVDPKVPTGQAIVAAGLIQVAHPLQGKGSHLIHHQFSVRGGGSGSTR